MYWTTVPAMKATATERKIPIITENAFSVIMGIFLSVAVAFIAGTVVQYISRLIFSFNYKKHLSWTIGIFGGIAVTALLYFILIEGLKSAPFMTEELIGWIDVHTPMLVAGCFVFLYPSDASVTLVQGECL